MITGDFISSHVPYKQKVLKAMSTASEPVLSSYSNIAFNYTCSCVDAVLYENHVRTTYLLWSWP
jgi:hypothetical protein